MKRILSQTKRLFAVLCTVLLVGTTFFISNSAQATQLPPGEYDHIGTPITATSDYGYSPYAGGRDFPQKVLWGDVHLHTVYSADAGAAGTRLTPEDSYRFARGEEIKTDSGQLVKLSRPLDFLAVTDHSDGLGSIQQLILGEPPEILEDPTVARWHEMINGTPEEQAQVQKEITEAFGKGEIPSVIYPPTEADFRTAWEAEVDVAEAYNNPGNFTAMIGYEWTSQPGNNNLHRNVLFRDDGCRAKLVLPFTTVDIANPTVDTSNPAKLWDWMENYEEIFTGNVLAIPHNGNLSNGLMFADTQYNDDDPLEEGEDLTADYARRRQLWEPLYEVIQIKGTSETHPLLSPTDEFAGFEIDGWDKGNMVNDPKPEDPEELKEMYSQEYARGALKNGLNFEKELGTNPFKFGLVGSSDSHIALSAVEENNYFGKFPIEAPSPERATDVTSVNRIGWQYVSSGYVGVWAQENTRESIFDAMERREVYATSGPRMVVRLFGGWDFTPEDVGRNPGDVGYAKGVPMGSDLPPVTSDLSENPVIPAPTFLVAALKDPIRANLDRIQIVKGWLKTDDQIGEGEDRTDEKVYDVVWSNADVRQVTNGKVPPVGSVVDSNITDAATDPGTVNTETAEWTNTIGAVELATVWTDPDFDPTERAFYYARVLEIPTPRWTDYDKAFFGDEWCAEAEAEDPDACAHIPLTLQERVYTSPIWYSPA
ncbi:MAG: DUF3604 domain-containing protein [Symploca sp. SIO2C1]|nr:DUF3604 domain-containing protein [Symploca sp. SIO2C1]